MSSRSDESAVDDRIVSANTVSIVKGSIVCMLAKKRERKLVSVDCSVSTEGTASWTASSVTAGEGGRTVSGVSGAREDSERAEFCIASSEEVTADEDALEEISAELEVSALDDV
jgi:hypothetical protein